MNNRNTQKKNRLLPELALAVLLFVIVGAIRVIYINHDLEPVTETGFYDMCKIVLGGKLPALDYGMGDLYAKLLYTLFWFMGNHAIAAVYLQLVLQMAALVLFYLAIRQMWSFVPALAVTSALITFPQFLSSLMVLDESNLFLVVLNLTLLFTAILLGRTARDAMVRFSYAVLFLVIGIEMGLAIYLDIFFAAAAVLTLILLMAVKRPKPAKGMQRRPLQLIVYLVGACGGFVLGTLSSSRLYEEGYLAVLQIYLDTQLDQIGQVTNYAPPMLLLFAIFLLAAVVFVVRGHVEKEAGALDDKEMPESIQIKELESFEEQKPKVNYIENPLPLPKPHVKKEMNYGFDPPSVRMKYDIWVSENDDYDIP